MRIKNIVEDCKFNVGDVIKIKNLSIMDIAFNVWDDEHLHYMGESFIVSGVDWNDFDQRYEVHCKDIHHFYFLECEIEEPIEFIKLNKDDFVL